MNGDDVDGVAMEVDPPLIPSSHRAPSQIPSSPQDRPPENFELNTEQIKQVLAFGKDLQRLYNSLTAETPNEKFKVLLQVYRYRKVQSKSCVLCCCRTPLVYWHTQTPGQVQSVTF